MNQAIDFFYQYAGRVLYPFMKAEPAQDDDRCAVCLRPATQWLHPDEKVVFTNYGTKESHCLACHSLYEGSEELFGIERLAKGTPVPMKLGMATGCGALITPTKTVLYLNGFIKKMGAAKKPPFEMLELSGRPAHRSVIENPPTEPEYLYIGNFGRKKAELVSNLALSSSSTLVICEESAQTIVPLASTRQLFEASDGLKPAQINSVKRVLRQLYTGATRPDDELLIGELTRIGEDTPQILEALKKMPSDPHERLNILQMW